MPFRQPLSKSQLKEIQARRKGDPDIKALLWEIRLLHSHILRAHQLSLSLTGVTGGAGIILNAMREELAEHPVIQERDASMAELLKKD